MYKRQIGDDDILHNGEYLYLKNKMANANNKRDDCGKYQSEYVAFEHGGGGDKCEALGMYNKGKAKFQIQKA